MTHKRKRKPNADGCTGPVAPGSTLYQLLQMLARAVAQELVNGPTGVERDRSKQKPKEPS
jgi:hypothetical protein